MKKQYWRYEVLDDRSYERNRNQRMRRHRFTTKREALAFAKARKKQGCEDIVIRIIHERRWD